jgi:AcrR family transcriptional regulator
MSTSARTTEASSAPETGRFRQRRRTRAAIVDAAAQLVASGATPSVNEIADAAGVSRRTVYQYFPTHEQLLLDATLGLLSQQQVDQAIHAAGTKDPQGAGSGDVPARVEAMIRELGDLSAETLPLGRKLIRLTVDGPPADDGGPRRGYRRVGWIEEALEPLRDQLPGRDFERLVSALSMVIGWEALIVLADLRGLSPTDQVDTSVWAADVLIKAALDQAGTAPPGDGR